jgi:ParB-like chromosome segregation protein Spo0J
MELEVLRIRIMRIRRDATLQVRAELNPEVIEGYVAAIRAGESIAPPVVYFDAKNYWLADGYCRVAAALKVGLSKVPVYVKMGVQRDALEYAFRRKPPAMHTNEDKRRAVEARLALAPAASNGAIARVTGASHTFVAKVRAERTCGNGCQIEPARDLFRGDSSYSKRPVLTAFQYSLNTMIP